MTGSNVLHSGVMYSGVVHSGATSHGGTLHCGTLHGAISVSHDGTSHDGTSRFDEICVSRIGASVLSLDELCSMVSLESTIGFSTTSFLETPHFQNQFIFNISIIL
jgi:hypothetical protein